MKMGSKLNRKNAAKQRNNSDSIDLAGRAAGPSFTDVSTRKPLFEHVRLTAGTTDSCSRSNDNSDASECELDCLAGSHSDWVLEDETLTHSNALTYEEVLERRSRRVHQLMKLYRAQFWGLTEEMRTKHRRFYIRNGKSGWRDDGLLAGDTAREAGHINCKSDDGDGVMRKPDRGRAENVLCGAQGCIAKPLPLTAYCVAHILLEPRQQLYKPCSYAIQTSQDGSVSCGRPVLRAVVPLLCAQHFLQVRKQANRSLSKVSPGFKSGHKFHLIIAQYVRKIQHRRKLRVSGEKSKNGHSP